jgi:hypothetical protein
MKLSKLNELQVSRNMIDVFGGYNHNLRIGDGEFYDMTNLSSDNYPVLSPRKQRGVYAVPTDPNGLVAKDALCYVDGSDFYINDYKVEMGLSVDGGSKNLISMGAYVIIMPDKKYINTADLSDYGDIEATVTTADTVTFELCKIDGVGYEGAVTQPTAPTDPNNMNLWIDTSSTPHTLKQYSTTSAMWVSIPTTYIKISAPGIGKPFSENDGVTISGITDEDIKDLNNTMVIWARGDNYIVVTGILDQTTTHEAAITVKRQMPNMDFVIESGNRLWGCRYGTALNGEVVNEIYASKLGDFKNWHCYAGISTDSYAATVGTDGQFTGAITHLGQPIFFKENCMHKVYGNYPANYRVQDTACRGVQKGCERSLAIVNEVLYYKSRSSVCAYDGSLPQEISYAFGEEIYNNAVAGALRNKYYISMSDANGLWHFFVYDTTKGMWHREDDTQATCFCNCRGDLYYIDYATNQIKTVKGTGALETTPIKWEAITGVIGTDSPDKKYVSRMDVRMFLEVGARVSFYAEYDSCGEWEHLFTMTGKDLRSFAVPIRTRRCDHLRLKITGEGDTKIYSICKTIEQGSDV